MGIDRIGRIGGSAGAILKDPVPVERTGASGETFQLDRTHEAQKPEDASPLDRLRAGQIDLPQYLDIRVQQATSHLEGKLDPERLDFVRRSLRIQIENDPSLIELVHAATGQAPKPSDDR